MVTIDKEEIRAKLDHIKQKLKQRVHAYYDKMEKLFTRGKLEDGEQKRKFWFKLKPEIRKLWVMRDHASMEALLNATLEGKRVLAKLGETPFELLRKNKRKTWLLEKM